MSRAQWVIIPQSNPQAQVRLLCIAYAGSGAEVFRSWPNNLSSQIEVCAIQLPGRGARRGEAPFTSLTLLIEALADVLRPVLDKPFAIFGYDLGALIGFELTRYLRQNSDTRPRHLFVAGHRAPQIPSNSSPKYNLPDAEFIDALREMKSIPAEVQEHAELLQLLLPILRAEIELAETYIYRAEPPLNVPLSAFGGRQDAGVTREELQSWQEQTTASFSLQIFAGDHFFLHSEQASLLPVINRELAA